jgi:hypothetical protein
VNFTREPIIETIITPKEGCKLSVRNSKGGGQEEYSVDAVEVVSFGHSFFFRSLERPKSFLVPVSDYEVIEVKETRVVLKNAPHERSIKIGGGRDAPIRHQREAPAEKHPESPAAEQGEPVEEESGMEVRMDKKRDRHRRRRRGGRGPEAMRPQESSPPSTEAVEEGGGGNDETQVSSPIFTKLLPPPTTLISETISRYKDAPFSEGNVLSKPVEEAKQEKEEEFPDSESHPLHRAASPAVYESRLSSSTLPEDHFLG